MLINHSWHILMNKKITDKLIFIDGGGTKTDSTYFSVKNNELTVVDNFLLNKMSNPSASLEITKESIEKVLSHYGNDLLGFTIVISIAGYTQSKEQKAMFDDIGDAFGVENIIVLTDIDFLLEAYKSAGEDVLVSIFGTGSSFMFSLDDKVHEVGGYGHLIGEEGAGFVFGRKFLSLALMDKDLGKKTKLVDLFVKTYGEESLSAATFKDNVYHKETNKNYISKFSTAVFTELKNDPSILNEVTDVLVSEAETVIHIFNEIFNYNNNIKTVVINGGIFKNTDTIYSQIVLSYLNSENKKAEYVDWSSTDKSPIALFVKKINNGNQ